MSIIDAHIHYGDDAPELLALLAEFDIRLHNICVAQDSHGAWRESGERYRSLAQANPQRYAWCTSFDLPRLDDPGYVDDVLAGLERDFAAGAVACKVWKNIGMEVRHPDERFLHVDDPLLAPIFAWLAERGYPLLAHIAEPLDCWLPLREDSPHYGYYSRNPEWHMYTRPDYPSHGELMAARDRVLAQHQPTLHRRASGQPGVRRGRAGCHPGPLPQSGCGHLRPSLRSGGAGLGQSARFHHQIPARWNKVLDQVVGISSR